MGTRSEKLRATQSEMQRGPPPITRATEGRLGRRAPLGIVTFICIGLAALGAIALLDGLVTGYAPAVTGGLGIAVFWALVAWGNEILRARRRRREGR